MLNVLSQDKQKKLQEKGLLYIYIILLLLSLSCGVSEAFSRNMVRILLALSVFGCVFVSVFRQRLMQQKKLLLGFGIIYAMLALSALSTGKFIEILDTNEVWYSYNILLMFILPCIGLKDSYIKKCMYMLFTMLLLNDILVIKQYLAGVPRPTGFQHGIGVMTTIYMVVTPMMLVAYFKSENKLEKLVLGVNLALAFLAIFFLNTRGAWLGIICVTVLIIAVYRYTVNWKRLLSIIAVTAIAILGITHSSNIQHSRVNSLLEVFSGQREDGRADIWRGTIAMIGDHPVTGVGVHRFQDELYTNYANAKMLKGHHHEHAHNIILHLWAENGIIGLGIVSLVVAYMLRQLWRSRQDTYAMMAFAATLGVLLYGMTDYPFKLYEGMRVYWLCMGLCFAGMNADALPEKE